MLIVSSNNKDKGKLMGIGMAKEKTADFGFEDLSVWQKAAEFSIEIIRMAGEIETDRRHYRLIEQLEACSTSIALNIAEGKGRFSRKEFIQYLYIARGSLFETIALLTIFQRNKWISAAQLEELRMQGAEIGKMLAGLISSIRKGANS